MIYLPKKFKLFDSGQYGHSRLYHMCSKQLSVLHDRDSNIKTYVFFDSNYQPLYGMIDNNGKIERINRLSGIFYNSDPRYIINNCKRVPADDLDIDGIFGYFYIITNTGSVLMICKFLDNFNYSTFLYMRDKNGKYIPILDQQWDYLIIPLE
jgi:hypothetical protein